MLEIIEKLNKKYAKNKVSLHSEKKTVVRDDEGIITRILRQYLWLRKVCFEKRREAKEKVIRCVTEKDEWAINVELPYLRNLIELYCSERDNEFRSVAKLVAVAFKPRLWQYMVPYEAEFDVLRNELVLRYELRIKLGEVG